MPNNKTPDCDGLPVEFYRIFWAGLKNVYFEALLYCIQNKRLYESTTREVINLIPKKGKDVLHLKNLRLSTLLNVDYKLYAKCLTNRLKSMLPQVISEDQTRFMAGRNISKNIRKMLDIIEYARRNKIAAVILSIDFEKCFDRIEHEAIRGSLNYYGYGENFIDMIIVLYQNITSCTQNSGYISQWFNTARGCFQGNPVAPHLYLLCGEVMADLLRANKDIKGIKIYIINFLSQFADDADLFLLFDKVSLTAVTDTLDIIERNTGLLINYSKTSIYRIGSIENGNAKLYTKEIFKWTNQPIKVLGVMVCNDSNQLCSMNYESVISKMQEVANNWYSRTLTMMGKVLVIHASLFVYKMLVLPKMSQEFV